MRHSRPWGLKGVVALGVGLLADGLVMSARADVTAANESLVEVGAQVFADNCQPCHGENLRSPTPNTDLKNLKSGDRIRFEQRVLDGKPPMPPWRGALGPAELEQLWAYIRANAYEK